MAQEGGRPQKPSDPHLDKWLRFIDPDDPSAIGEFAIKDTGITSPDGHKRYALVVDPSEIGSKTIEVLGFVSIAPGATFTGNAIELKNNKGGAVTVRVDFDAANIAGIEAWLESSDNGTNWDSTDAKFVTGLEPVFTANVTKQKTTLIDTAPKYIRLIMKNLDGATGQANCLGNLAMVD